MPPSRDPPPLDAGGGGAPPRAEGIGDGAGAGDAGLAGACGGERRDGRNACRIGWPSEDRGSPLTQQGEFWTPSTKELSHHPPSRGSPQLPVTLYQPMQANTTKKRTNVLTTLALSLAARMNGNEVGTLIDTGPSLSVVAENAMKPRHTARGGGRGGGGSTVPPVANGETGFPLDTVPGGGQTRNPNKSTIVLSTLERCFFESLQEI